MSDVVDLDAAREQREAPAATPNLRCTSCGGEWWEAAVVLDASTRRVTGYGQAVCCCACGEPPP